MAFRVLSVRQRAIQAIQDNLMLINQANGYNFTVLHVERKRTIPDRHDDPPSIYMMLGKTEVDQHYNAGQDREVGTLELWFAVPEPSDFNADADVEFNLFINDLKRNLTCIDGQEIKDMTHADGQGRVVDILIDSYEPEYSSNLEGQVRGRMIVFFQYTCMKSNPNLWDRYDEEVIKEE